MVSELKSFYRNRIRLTKQFIDYLNRRHIKPRKAKGFPENFNETFKNQKDYKWVIRELVITTMVSQTKYGYITKYTPIDLVALLKKLEELELLKFPLYRNYKNYGRVLNTFFNTNYTLRPFSQTNLHAEKDPFCFLNIIKSIR